MERAGAKQQGFPGVYLGDLRIMDPEAKDKDKHTESDQPCFSRNKLLSVQIVWDESRLLTVSKGAKTVDRGEAR